jgi:anaerobic nitric oxide reductase transcription regulator
VRIDAVAAARLVESDWPGNVRELENVIARAVLRAAAPSSCDAAPLARCAGVIVTISDLTSASTGARSRSVDAHIDSSSERPLRDQVVEFERRVITEAIARHDGNWAAAARTLGMHRSNLHHLATRLGLRER